MKIITVGSALTDIFIQTESVSQLNFNFECENRSFILFQEGCKVNIDKLNFHTGGGATNSAVSFKRLGCEVAALLKTGKDKPAEFILQRLIDAHISTDFIKQSEEQITGHSFIFPCKNGDRTVLTYRGANNELTDKDIPASISEYHAYITSLSGSSAAILLPLVQKLKQNNRVVAVNPGNQQLSSQQNNVYDALAFIDIFIVNATEAACFMRTLMERDALFHQTVLQTKRQPVKKGLPILLAEPMLYQDMLLDIRLLFKELLKRGPKIILVTNGAEGVYCATLDGIIFHPSIPTQIVNTIGAGDAFGSCFVAQYLLGASLKDALLYGILNAASILTYLDAKSGLLTQDELETKLKALQTRSYYETKIY